MTSPSNLKQPLALELADFVQDGLNARVRGVIRLEADPRATFEDLSLNQVGQLLPDMCLVYSDLKPWISAPLDDFLLDLAKKMSRKLRIPSLVNASSSTFSSEFLPHVFVALGGNRRLLVLVLDHLELVGTPGHPGTVGHALLPFLHQIRDQVPEIGLIVITRSKIQELQRGVIDFVKESTSFAIRDMPKERPRVGPDARQEKFRPRRLFLAAIGAIAIVIVTIILLIGAPLLTSREKMLCDGDFDQVRLVCWDHGGETSTVEKETQHVVLLGNPDWGCKVSDNESKVESWISQRVKIPATGKYELSFKYRIASYEMPESGFYPFEVLFNDQAILQAGNTAGRVNCSSSPADSGWLLFRQAFRFSEGDTIFLEFHNKIDAGSKLNTWAYVDSAQLTHISGE